MLKIGNRAPDFRLPVLNGKRFGLKDLKGKKVVLYFYPKDSTAGCTAEACSFEKNISSFKEKGTVVVGVSADDIGSHLKFAKANKLTFRLVSDIKREAIKKYGVWKEKSMYGKKYFGIERSTFVIDEKGIIKHIFRKVKVAGHTDELLTLL
jgi:peroxiredoxin Q/BCP